MLSRISQFLDWWFFMRLLTSVHFHRPCPRHRFSRYPKGTRNNERTCSVEDPIHYQIGNQNGDATIEKQPALAGSTASWRTAALTMQSGVCSTCEPHSPTSTLQIYHMSVRQQLIYAKTVDVPPKLLLLELRSRMSCRMIVVRDLPHSHGGWRYCLGVSRST